MDENATYTQPVKIQARERLLSHAVRVLTEHRSSAPVTREKEFEAVIRYACDHIAKYGGPTSWRNELPTQMKRWHDFHRTHVGIRKPSDLKVLYLAGPEPLNDLGVLMRLGVLPENIWGVESDKKLQKGY